jgi:3,4-dihydroxy-9,10-secoandrosta-1,3,5(10)-triene-9,17-dione 4,5-dioxygenase
MSMIDIRGLAYIVAESVDPGRWRQFGRNVLGTMESDAPEGGAYLKMDDRAFRIAVQRGGSDRYVASGWEVADQSAFEIAVADLRRAGVEANRATETERAMRMVQDMVWVVDPSGNRHEIVWGHKTDGSRFVSPQGVSSFVTGDLGMGHTVLPAPNFDATWDFMRTVMGFGLTDILRLRFTPDPSEPEKRIYFLHCNNGRHHSLALFEFPMPNGCVHVMLEVDSFDEVGRAHDRLLKNNGKLTATLGRHVNDRMISFYMNSPSNFAIEYGYGGLVVDWSRHIVFEATSPSLWGHDFSVGFKM